MSFFRHFFARRPTLQARITERIAQLEAERDRAVFAYNAAIGELQKLLSDVQP